MQLGSSGDDSKRDTPVPIPNTEVKPLNADGTWLVTTRESRKLPVTKKTHADLNDGVCFFVRKNIIMMISCALKYEITALSFLT